MIPNPTDPEEDFDRVLAAESCLNVILVLLVVIGSLLIFYAFVKRG